MVISRVAGQTPQAHGLTGVTSIQVTLPQNVVAGNAVMVVGKSRSGGTITFSDGLSNTYATDIETAGGADNDVAIGSAKDLSTGGSCTVTASTTAGADRMGISAMEYSGFTGGAVFDQSASNIGTSTSADSGSTPTTTAADELLIGGASDAGATTYSWTSSFSLVAEHSTGRHSMGDRIVASTGTYNATATLGISTLWNMVIATYKEAGGAPAILRRNLNLTGAGR